ncbi:hypothetical protein [Agromyces salentinus]|uniref:Uncharacterized protein n=1 Tax=Agromyces salentinus TaxID=269421 RepID=A0ABP4YQ80_9MICO|nr:hypothetical protein [Agromyces salentinus]
MGRISLKPAVLIAIGGILLTAAYAGLGALQILVLNPLAAAPGLALHEIHAALEAAGESVSPLPVVIFVGSGLLLSLGVWLYSTASSSASPQVAAVLVLLILAFGAPAYFAASFAGGMALADAFAISGGDHSPWSNLLYLTSSAAFVSAIALPVVLALRSRRVSLSPRPST